jgi:hypothetical protein
MSSTYFFHNLHVAFAIFILSAENLVICSLKLSLFSSKSSALSDVPSDPVNITKTVAETSSLPVLAIKMVGFQWMKPRSAQGTSV